MMNSQQPVVLITGSSGLIGYATACRFVRDYDVMGFDRVGPPHPPPETEYVLDCDVTSDDSVRHALAEVRRLRGDRIASVIHLAAYYDFSGEPSSLYDEVTVRGTQRLLRALQDFQVEQFIFSSTMLVHAPCEPGERINEDWPLEPKWDYPQSKVETERLICAERGEIPVVMLRISGVYNDFCHSIPLAHQMQRIHERQITGKVFPGDITHGQSFLHLDDLVDALQLTVVRRAQLPPETVILLGEPETLSYDELQREFGRLIHGPETEWETHQIPKTLAKTGAWFQDLAPVEAVTGAEPFIKPWMIDLADEHYALDISRARQLLGWEPKHSLRATLPKMAAALQADPLDWYRKNNLEAPSWVEESSDAHPQTGQQKSAERRAPQGPAEDEI